MTNTRDSQNVCCPEFDTKPWDEKSLVWKDKLFIQDNVIQFLHIPLNMGQVVNRMFKKIKEAGDQPQDKEFLMLAYDPSPWKSELYMSVTKEVPEAKNVKLSGEYLTKVFDGPYNAVPKWIAEMEKFVASKDKKVERYYFYYTTCPKCAKKYGHNYCVTFAKVS